MSVKANIPKSHLRLARLAAVNQAWKASAIGKNMVNAKTFLEKR
jgi:hypothetical protein